MALNIFNSLKSLQLMHKKSRLINKCCTQLYAKILCNFKLPNTIIMVSYNRYFYESNIFNYSMQDVPSECVVSTSLGVNTTDMRGKKYYRHAAHR
uniref:Uncharacterized protein n=1 Tax=Glossina pallidipes TaxID=7398 RepID=A0A1A9ZTM9_GLOPL